MYVTKNQSPGNGQVKIGWSTQVDLETIKRIVLEENVEAEVEQNNERYEDKKKSGNKLADDRNEEENPATADKYNNALSNDLQPVED